MGSNILGIGQSGLAAAQAGISTTGHNIANAATPGYSRQILVQTANEPQQLGGSYIGQGTSISTIKRMYNQFLAAQVNTSQTSKNQADTYNRQITQINNLVADASAGVSPVLQDFFKSIQNVSATPNGTAGATARQAALSSAQALTGRLNGLQGRLDEIRNGVEGEIQTTVATINTYANQLAGLNDAIERAYSVSQGAAPNDLLDQRDQVVTELSKLIQVSVVKQDPRYNVFIGNGQPIVVGGTVNQLQTSISATDNSRMEVSYVYKGTPVQIAENSLTGGTLGGLFAFRLNTLDTTQNALGRVAVGLAMTFNDQHKLGQDLSGQMGTNFFSVASPLSTASANNTGTAQIAATVTNAQALTTSDYRVQFVGGNYRVTRVSDGTTQVSATLPLTFDGIQFALAPPPAGAAPAANDEFLVKPTAKGASSIAVALNDTAKIAVAAPVATSIPTTNTGSGKISAGAVDNTYVPATLAAPVRLTFSANAFTGFPVGSNVTVTNNGVTTSYGPYVAGTPVPYTSGATISFSGISFSVTGNPANADVFDVAKNTNGTGDNRNGLLLAALQTKNLLAGSTPGNSTTFQGAYSQMVSQVGNKAQELNVSSAFEAKLLEQANSAQQAESGVNLDEEATNLLRYQQAYQAAGKLMQVASQMFDFLLKLGA